VPVVPPEVVVHDEEEACVYLPGRRARQPLREPVRPLTGAEFDERLAGGDRRAGTLLYNQACPSCAACEALRVDVRAFEPSRSQRRAHAKADPAVTVQLGPIEVNDARIALYRAHERGRGLDRDGRPPIDALGYESIFAMSCVEGFELRYLVGGRLAGVAITDRGARALSAVYTFWDPAYAALSLGTYSILTQIALARRMGLDWLYLGLAIRDNHSMAYKLAFMPHERRIDGGWRRFARGG
jgi:arginine-tRNA-protein transferase